MPDWEDIQSTLNNTDLSLRHLEILQSEYAWHPEIQQSLQGRVLMHPDISPDRVQAALPFEVPVLLLNPALPFFLLERPDFFHQFTHRETLFAFINHETTPEWLLQALRQHPYVPLAYATRLHRAFYTVVGEYEKACCEALCHSPIPSVTTRAKGSAFIHPDTSRRRRFATVPHLPTWAMPVLGGNPERVFSPERQGRMVIEAANSEDDLLIFLAYGLPTRRFSVQTTIEMASSYRWAERLAACIRPETPEEAMIVLTDDTNALVHATASARMEGEDVFVKLWGGATF
jgi:hypothetical protein